MRRLLATVAVSGLCAAHPALAQSAVEEPLAEGGIAEIVVTAERRTSTAQRTPIAMTAISGEELAAQAKTSLDEVIRSTPSVRIQETAGGAGVFLRGVGSNDTGFGDPSINFNVDGVYQQSPGIISFGLFDVNRVEVLRGPQGTLYGRNATAGSLNLITNDPELGTFGGSVRLTGGNFDRLRGEGVLNVGIGDSVAARVAVFGERRDGYASPTGQDDTGQLGIRAKLLYEPSSNFRAVLSVMRLENSGHGPATYALPAVGTDRNDLADPWTDAALTDGLVKYEFTNVNAQLEWSLGGARLTVVPALVETFRDQEQLRVGGIHQIENESQKLLEVRLASDNDSPLTWTVGANYIDGTYNRATPNAVGTTTYSNDQFQYLRSFGVFGQATYAVSDQFRLTAGLRYSSDRKSRSDHWVNTLTPFDVSDVDSPARTFSSLDYKVGLELDFADRSMLYATVSSGYKSGGFHTFAAVGAAVPTFEPEDLQAYEIGVKNRFFDNRVQLNLSAYYYDYTNYQVKFPVIQPGAFTVQTVNAGAATLKGAELEAVVEVSDNDLLSAYLTYSDTRFDSFSYIARFPFGPRTFDYTGDPLPNAPTFTARLAYEHRFDLGNGATLTPRMDTSYSDGYFVTHERFAAVPPPQLATYPSGLRPIGTYQSSYFKTDASLRYEDPSGLGVTAFVKNIENVAVATGGGSDGVYLQPPRTYGISLDFSF